jgi:Flp pilus assembly protein TadG
LPLFLVLLLATIDFGNGLRHYMVMTNAAREGARYGAVGNTQADIVTKVVNYGDTVGIAAGDVVVTNAEGDSGEEITVSVSKNYNYITPLGGILGVLSGGTLPDPLPLSASATMRLE